MPHDIRSELSALQDDLANETKPTSSQSASSERMDSPAKEKWTDMDRALRELQTQLADAVEEAESLVTEHPFSAVAAAFILGVVAGRLMGATK